jgi:hypothetical protein
MILRTFSAKIALRVENSSEPTFQPLLCVRTQFSKVGGATDAAMEDWYSHSNTDVGRVLARLSTAHDADTAAELHHAQFSPFSCELMQSPSFFWSSHAASA